MYQYTDCYLDNIWLINGYQFKSTSDGDYAVVKDVDGLHDLMMNMEVASILNLGEQYYFEYSPNGWQRVKAHNLRLARKSACPDTS